MQDKKHHKHHSRHSLESLESDENLDDCEIQEKIMEKAQNIFMKWLSGKFNYNFKMNIFLLYMLKF